MWYLQTLEKLEGRILSAYGFPVEISTFLLARLRSGWGRVKIHLTLSLVKLLNRNLVLMDQWSWTVELIIYEGQDGRMAFLSEGFLLVSSICSWHQRDSVYWEEKKDDQNSVNKYFSSHLPLDISMSPHSLWDRESSCPVLFLINMETSRKSIYIKTGGLDNFS